MIDSHCHLDHSSLYEKLDEIINRAELSGVGCLLTISTSLKSFEIVKRIILKYQFTGKKERFTGPKKILIMQHLAYKVN